MNNVESVNKIPADAGIIAERVSFRVRLRKRLTVSGFSIISNNCVGGVMLHDLGHQFLTPTVNLCMSLKDFYLYISHLSDFQNAELIEKKDSGKSYPVGILCHPEVGSVTLFFLHYSTFEEARDKWIERSKRIRFDKICIVVYTVVRDYDLLRKIDALPYPKMIITNERHCGIKNEYLIDVGDNTPDAIFSFKDKGSQRYLDDIDYVSFLNNAFADKVL